MLLCLLDLGLGAWQRYWTRLLPAAAASVGLPWQQGLTVTVQRNNIAIRTLQEHRIACKEAVSAAQVFLLWF
jgi:hypothetical protein